MQNGNVIHIVALVTTSLDVCNNMNQKNSQPYQNIMLRFYKLSQNKQVPKIDVPNYY